MLATNRVLRFVIISALLVGLNTSVASATEYLRPVVSELSAGIKFKMPTRVEAGKYFQATIISKKSKLNGICWLDWEFTKGFTIPQVVKMRKGIAKGKVLPVEPGAGTVSFYCGPRIGDALIGGRARIYIAP